MILQKMQTSKIYFFIGLIGTLILISFVSFANAQETFLPTKSFELAQYNLTKDLTFIPVPPVVVRDVIINKIILSDGVICYKYINSISCIKN